MTRTRKATGHISFVGAGPGDPGLLTQRALEALASADHVVFDRGIPEPLLGTVRAGAHEEAQFSPAEGASGDVAKVLLSAARSGLHAVHLVAGDPFGHESVARAVPRLARTGRSRARYRRSRSNRRVPRRRWSAPSRVWSTAGTPGWCSPPSTPYARSGRSSPSTGWTPGTSAA